MIYLFMELLGMLVAAALAGFLLGWWIRGLDERAKRKAGRRP